MTDEGHTVAMLLADMWSLDSETEREAIERAATVKDPRLGEALVGKMWADVMGSHPTYYYSELVVGSLRAQGFRVDVLQDSYAITWPDDVRRSRIPFEIPMYGPRPQR